MSGKEAITHYRHPYDIIERFINLKKVDLLAGIIILVSICNLFALNVLAIFINSLSVLLNPFNISSIVTINEIISAITIIAGIPAPTQIIITGPKAILGKLFKTTKNGSDTLEIKFDHHKIMAIKEPNIVPSKKPIIVS